MEGGKYKAEPVDVTKILSPCKVVIQYSTRDEFGYRKLESDLTRTWNKDLAYDADDNAPVVGMVECL